MPVLVKIVTKSTENPGTLKYPIGQTSPNHKLKEPTAELYYKTLNESRTKFL